MTKAVRIIALIMAILMGVSAIGMIAMYVAAETYDGTSVSASLSGAGTEADPYLISNGADLAYFAANPVDGASYKLVNDIVWSSYVKGAEVPAASNWTPIVFNGNFDGNGKTVSGLCVISDADYVGFVIPDEFVVGYGLDYAQDYRNLPFIGVLDPKAYA